MLDHQHRRNAAKAYGKDGSMMDMARQLHLDHRCL